MNRNYFEHCVYACTGGGSPSIVALTWSGKQLQPTVLFRSPSSASFYCLALSPDATRLAVADKAGYIFVLDLIPEVKLIAQFLHAGGSPAVTGLCFADHDHLASAGVDCQLRLYSVATNTKLRVINNPAPVFALTALPKLQIAGMCRSNHYDHIQVWNIETGALVHTGPPFKMGGFYLNNYIAVSQEMEAFIHADRNGTLHAYAVTQGFAHHQFQTSHGNFYATAFAKNMIITAGEQDCQLQRWSAGPELIDSISLDMPVTWLHPLDHRTVVAAAQDGRLRIIDHQDGLKIIAQSQISDLRGLTGPSEAWVLEREQDKRSQRAIELLNDFQTRIKAGDFKPAYDLIVELENLGFHQQAIEAIAAAENMQNHLLTELEALLTRIRMDKLSESSLLFLKRIVELLELLHEPEQALQHYIILEELQPGSIDLATKTAELLPRFTVTKQADDPVILAGYPDIETRPELTRANLLLEINKARVLGRGLSEQLVFREKSHGELAEVPDFAQLLEKLKQHPQSSQVFAELMLATATWKLGAKISPGVATLIGTPKSVSLQQLRFLVITPQVITATQLRFHGAFYNPSIEQTPDEFAAISKHMLALLANQEASMWLSSAEKLFLECFHVQSNQSSTEDLYS